MNDNRASVNRNRLDVWSALLIFGACGLASVLVDIDHVLKAIIPALPWRVFHPIAFFMASVFSVYNISRLGRLYLRMVLK